MFHVAFKKATREGVEKLPNSKRFNIASSQQHDLILSVVKQFPESKKFLEYDDYYAMPTRENANEFLNAVAERYADRADELKGLVSYISNRPGVEKLGSHRGTRSESRRCYLDGSGESAP